MSTPTWMTKQDAIATLDGDIKQLLIETCHLTGLRIVEPVYEKLRDKILQRADLISFIVGEES